MEQQMQQPLSLTRARLKMPRADSITDTWPLAKLGYLRKQCS